MPGFLELLILAFVLGVPVVGLVVLLVILSVKKNQGPATGNLTSCADCGRAVSMRAETCPHCGAPLKPSM